MLNIRLFMFTERYDFHHQRQKFSLPMSSGLWNCIVHEVSIKVLSSFRSETDRTFRQTEYNRSPGRV